MLLSIFVYWSTIVECKCYFWLSQYSQEFDSEDHDSKHYLLEMYTKTSAEYFIYIDASAHITVETIPELVSYQKPVISPLCKFVLFYLRKNDSFDFLQPDSRVELLLYITVFWMIKRCLMSDENDFIYINM